jgi:hypothetical protein
LSARAHILRSIPVLAALLALAPTRAQAAPKYAHGYYAEAGLGTGFFLGDAGKYIAPGPSFALRSGYDLFPWFSVGGRLVGGIHEGDVPPPPEQEYFQLLEGAAEGRLTVRFRRVALFVQGALGFGYITTNLLDRVGVTSPDSYLSALFGAGGGIDYHTQNRHFSFGLTADYSVYPTFDGAQGVSVRLYLRYVK